MKITLDKEISAGYIGLSDNSRYSYTREYKGLVYFDFDIDGNLKGIELIGGELKEIFKHG